jgi:hypothetical protein
VGKNTQPSAAGKCWSDVSIACARSLGSRIDTTGFLHAEFAPIALVMENWSRTFEGEAHRNKGEVRKGVLFCKGPSNVRVDL